jgi:hypothetical protein
MDLAERMIYASSLQGKIAYYTGNLELDQPKGIWASIIFLTISAHGVLNLFFNPRQFAVGCGKQASQIGCVFQASTYSNAYPKLDLDFLVE